MRCTTCLAMHPKHISTGLTMKMVRSLTMPQVSYLLHLTGPMTNLRCCSSQTIMNGTIPMILLLTKYPRDSTYLTMMQTMFYLLVMRSTMVMMSACMLCLKIQVMCTLSDASIKEMSYSNSSMVHGLLLWPNGSKSFALRDLMSPQQFQPLLITPIAKLIQ